MSARNSVCLRCGDNDGADRQDANTRRSIRWLRHSALLCIGVCEACEPYAQEWDVGRLHFHADIAKRVHAQRRRQCRSCGADIVWLMTARGRPIPVNFETVAPSEAYFMPPEQVSHFASCPNAAQHRR